MFISCVVKRIRTGIQDLLQTYGSALINITTLIYYEAYHNKEDARSKEKQLKSGMGKEYIKRRLKRFLTLTG